MKSETNNTPSLFGSDPEQAPPLTTLAPGEILVDPARCSPWRGNARFASPFCPERSRELIESIVRDGQRTAVILRPAGAGAFEILAGQQRHGAVTHLVAKGRDIKLLARIVDVSDEEAWVIAQAENAGRRDITPLQRARSWHWAMHKFHGGRQDVLATAVGRDEATVSRTLALLRIPPEILAVLDDADAMSVNFAAKLIPQLEDAERQATIMARADEMAALGLKFSPSKALERLLLTTEEVDARKPVDLVIGQKLKVRLIRKVDGSIVFRVAPSAKKLSRSERTALRRALQQTFEEVLAGAK